MKKRERRKYGRIPVIHAMRQEVMMYLSPPLIQDPVPVTVNELSAGGMKLETTVPLPTRFLFTIIFSPPGMNKIYAEGKAIHVLKTKTGFRVGVEFTKIDLPIIEKINHIARDVEACDRRREEGKEPVCIGNCAYTPICRRKEKNDPCTS